MSDKTTTRRQVLRACGAACLTATAATASADETAAQPQSESMDAAESLDVGSRSGIYPGTVDRIVDGEHVVVLLAERSDSPWQFVFDHSDAPAIEENDHVWLWLWRGQLLSVWRR